MMLSLWVPEARACVQPLGSQRRASILHAYRNSSLPEVIPLLPREASMLRSESEFENGGGRPLLGANRLEACTRMTGDGTCTTP